MYSTGHQSTYRLILNFLARSEAINPTPHDLHDFNNRCTFTDFNNMNDPNSAIAQLVIKDSTKIILEDGMNYLSAGLRNVLSKIADKVVEILFGSKYSNFFGSTF